MTRSQPITYYSIYVTDYPCSFSGRRDILGAAETGSGKTLAFGIPILSGILKLKERQAAGEDINEVPYKKSSTKRKPNCEPVKQTKNKKKKIVKKKSQDSSEEGYSSDSETDNASNNDKDYLEEYDVPLRKKEASTDEGNDSDSENYVHLSEMIDSDDLAESSDYNGSDNDIESDSHNEDDIENDSHNEDTDSQNEYDDANEGKILLQSESHFCQNSVY